MQLQPFSEASAGETQLAHVCDMHVALAPGHPCVCKSAPASAASQAESALCRHWRCLGLTHMDGKGPLQHAHVLDELKPLAVLCRQLYQADAAAEVCASLPGPALQVSLWRAL